MFPSGKLAWFTVASPTPRGAHMSRGTIPQNAPLPQTTPAVPAAPAVVVPKPKGNLYLVTQQQLDKAARAMNLSPTSTTILSQPKNELIVNFPVRMDDGPLPALQGLPRPAQQHPRPLQGRHPLPRGRHARRAQGPRRGDDLEVARCTTSRSAAARAASSSTRACTRRRELERITRRYTHALGNNIGPEFDIPAPDVGTNAPDHGLDHGHVHERRRLRREERRAPRRHRQDHHRAAAATAARRRPARASSTASPSGPRTAASTSTAARFIVQGFGNVGSLRREDPVEDGRHARRRRRLQGLHRQPRGHQPAQALRARRRDRLASRATSGAKPITRDEFFALEADIFVPAALELEIGENEAQALKVQGDRRGRQRPDLPRGRADPARPRHRRAARHPRQLGRRRRLLLRVAAEQALASAGTSRRSSAASRSA